MAPHSSTLAWKIPLWRSLIGCSPWGREESDTTERLPFHNSLSCIGKGNSNPLQCSCLENPRDGGAWWAVVYGVAQSQTQLKQLSSSSSMPSIQKSLECHVGHKRLTFHWSLLKLMSNSCSSISSSALSFLYSPTLPSIHNYWKNHSLD